MIKDAINENVHTSRYATNTQNSDVMTKNIELSVNVNVNVKVNVNGQLIRDPVKILSEQKSITKICIKGKANQKEFLAKQNIKDYQI